MAIVRTTLKDRTQTIIEKADKFIKPTFLINCMKCCSVCKNLYPFVDDAFIKYMAEKGYDVYINKDDAKSTYNWNKYGRPLKVGAGTPQFYLINGEKVVGTSPATAKWSSKALYAAVDKLLAKMK